MGTDKNENSCRFPRMLLGSWALLPVEDETNQIEARTLLPTLAQSYPVCNESTPCADPNHFCGAKLEAITSWFMGYRCYAKKTAGWLCNSGNVCVSGTCNMIAFKLGYCSA